MPGPSAVPKPIWPTVNKQIAGYNTRTAVPLRRKADHINWSVIPRQGCGDIVGKAQSRKADDCNSRMALEECRVN
ncbi:hypothetical protein MHU86_2055 [Fragilaria crotonensis]|nr:hypothetical protein MHU86_2055 [Fragilaria crotonensis]